jgi:hypothetical protein
MESMSVSFVPEDKIVPVRIYANIDNKEDLLCATPVLLDTMLLQLPSDTWNVIIEIGE